ncbi:hypothetical protein [Parasitella parasitica]|uniref:Uncharacterized protein n=1 Tax=Parasitella parasitica TaxID=35722 RepID=A0A0B7NHZ7_9FUNG|nr:hypothetical protein [Parasitella parasitica]
MHFHIEETVPNLTDEMYETMSDNVIALLKRSASTSLKVKGNQAFTEKRYHDAIQLYTQAICFLADPIFYSNRAACFSNLGNMDRVIADCSEALRLNPTYIRALQRRAQAYEVTGDESNALFDYTAISILEGFKNEGASEASERLLKSIAEQKAKELIKTKPHRLPSSVFITAYLNSFRPDKNIDKLPYVLYEYEGDAYFVKAKAALEQKKYHESLEYIKIAVELGCTNQASAFNLKGTLSFLEGQSDVALEAFDQALILDPCYTQVYIKKSDVYVEKGDLKTALANFEIVAQMDLMDAEAYYHRGQIYFVSGHHDLALKDYTESVRLDPTFVYSQIQLAVVEHKLGNHSKAVDIFLKASTQFPTCAEIYNFYGEILIDKGKTQGAIGMFTKAMALDPTHPIPYINKAMILYQNLGKPEEAIQLCKNALDVDPACDAAVASLAQMLVEQNRPSEALIYYEKSIDLARTLTELTHAISYVEATKTRIRFLQKYGRISK